MKNLLISLISENIDLLSTSWVGIDSKVSLSEWLRSETWNLMGFPRAGSNPAADVLLLKFYQFNEHKLYSLSILLLLDFLIDLLLFGLFLSQRSRNHRHLILFVAFFCSLLRSWSLSWRLIRINPIFILRNLSLSFLSKDRPLPIVLFNLHVGFN